MSGAPRFGLQAKLLSPAAVRAVGEPLFRLFGRRPNDTPAPRDYRSILVVRLDEIGDVVLSTGMLRELRRNWPQAHITLVVKPAVFNLVELCPHVNEVLTFDRQYFGRRFGLLTRHRRALRLARTKLWSRRFDVAINPRRGVDYYHGDILTYLSGAPRRIGMQNAIGEPETSDLLTIRLPPCGERHEALCNLETVKALGGEVGDESLELWLSDDDRRKAASLLNDSGVAANAPFVVVAPGAGAAQLVWPLERSIDAAKQISADCDLRIVVVGGTDDRAYGARFVQASAETTDLTGKLSLRETAAVIERARLFLGNDSGPLHLAAAVGTPTIEISSCSPAAPHQHVNSPARFGPWQVPSIVLQPDHAEPPCVGACSAATAHCILQISVDEVVAAIKTMLARTAAPLTAHAGQHA